MSGPRIAPAAVFELAAPLDRPPGIPVDLRLPALEWGLLLSVTGRHTVARIGEHLGLAEAERDRAFGHLLELGLIIERRLTLAEYVRAAATVPGEPGTLVEFLSGGLRGLAAPGDPGISAPEPAVTAPETAPEPAPLDPFEPLTLPEEETVMPAIHPTPSARPSQSLALCWRNPSVSHPRRPARCSPRRPAASPRRRPPLCSRLSPAASSPFPSPLSKPNRPPACRATRIPPPAASRRASASTAAAAAGTSREGGARRGSTSGA